MTDFRRILPIVGIALATLWMFPSVKYESFLPIDGSSLITGSSSICVIEQRPGISIGGKLVCFENDVDVPHDVSGLNHNLIAL